LTLIKGDRIFPGSSNSNGNSWDGLNGFRRLEIKYKYDGNFFWNGPIKWSIDFSKTFMSQLWFFPLKHCSLVGPGHLSKLFESAWLFLGTSIFGVREIERLFHSKQVYFVRSKTEFHHYQFLWRLRRFVPLLLLCQFFHCTPMSDREVRRPMISKRCQCFCVSVKLGPSCSSFFRYSITNPDIKFSTSDLLRKVNRVLLPDLLLQESFVPKRSHEIIPSGRRVF
jgi:hypothetical protein